MKKMPIMIVSRADVRRIHTMRLLDGAKIGYTVFVHDAAARDRLSEAGIRGKIVVCNTKTLVEKRNYILDHAAEGEWFIGMDDNIQHFTMVAPSHYDYKINETDGDPPRGKTWRQVYNQTVTPQAWLEALSFNVAKAKGMGAPMVGVSTMENPYFRSRHYSNYRFVKTKVFAMRNVPDLRFKHEMCHDSYISAQAVARYGLVLVDNFMHYKATMYEIGGLGDRADRERLGLLEQMDDICREFPGLVTIGKGANTALKFRLVTKNGVQRWREEQAR